MELANTKEPRPPLSMLRSLAGKEPQNLPLKVDLCGFYARDNAKEHHTDQFELVQDPTATPVLRRGLPFFFAVRFDRQYDPAGDIIRLQFGFGECQINLL